jgi:hypothetical protein
LPAFCDTDSNTYDAEQVDAASLQRAHREGPAALAAAQGVVQVIEVPCSPLASDCRCCGPPRRRNITACCADGWLCVVQAREQAKRQVLGLPATATEAQVPPPRHTYPDRNPDLTEIYLRFGEIQGLVVC